MKKELWLRLVMFLVAVGVAEAIVIVFSVPSLTGDGIIGFVCGYAGQMYASHVSKVRGWSYY